MAHILDMTLSKESSEQLGDLSSNLRLPLTHALAPDWGVVLEGSEQVRGCIHRVKLPQGDSTNVGNYCARQLRVPLIFCHSIVGFVPVPSLRLLQLTLHVKEMWCIAHPGYLDGVSFQVVSVQEMARSYARVSCQALCRRRKPW